MPLKFHQTITPEGHLGFYGSWGSAIYDRKTMVLWIPAIYGRMSTILRKLYSLTGATIIVFARVKNPPEFKKHLKNIFFSSLIHFMRTDEVTYCIGIFYKEVD